MIKEKSWNYEQIELFDTNGIAYLYRMAAARYPGGNFYKVLAVNSETKKDKAWW